jgi:uncharacterized membrane protein
MSNRLSRRNTISLISVVLVLGFLVCFRGTYYSSTGTEAQVDTIVIGDSNYAVRTVCSLCGRRYIPPYTRRPSYDITFTNLSKERTQPDRAILSIAVANPALQAGPEMLEIELPADDKPATYHVDLPPGILTFNTVGLAFELKLIEDNNTRYSGPITASWQIPLMVLLPYWVITLTVGSVLIGVILAARGAKSVSDQKRATDERLEAQVTVANELAIAHPEQAKFAWDIARLKLEAYFDRNLLQVRQVFWVACIVMIVGFIFVLIGIGLAIAHPESLRPSAVAACSGIITQFIGATFMVIYRSTMAQANEFMTVLERINRVGMAVQIVDVLPDSTELKNDTRAQIATLLLGSMPKGPLEQDNRVPRPKAKRNVNKSE